jgi:flagellar assembly protein FliH
MTATTPLSRPFAFDTEFGAGGAVLSTVAFRTMKRAYLPAEVEALVAQARVEAREAALAEVESIRSLAVSAIGQALASGIPALAEVARAHREQSAALALAAGRVIAASAVDRFPQGPLQSAIETLAQEIDASPRLLVRAAGLDDEARELISRICADAGFTGVVAFHQQPGPAAAFALEWADGRAEFDPDGVAARLADALSSALAAEAGHAETIPAAPEFSGSQD